MRKWLKKLGVLLAPCVVLQGLAFSSGLTAAAASTAIPRTGWSGSAYLTQYSNANDTFDANVNSRWTNGSSIEAGNWYQIDLGAACDFNYITLLSGGNDYPAGYDVQVSSNGTDWATAASQAGAASQSFYMPVQHARYIKFVATGNKKGGWWSIYDINVYLNDDGQAPTAPTGVTCTGYNNLVRVSMSGATDDFAVAGYIVFRNGAEIGRTSSKVYIDAPLANTTSYTYSAKAIDYSGNISDMSVSAAGQEDPSNTAVPHDNWGASASDMPLSGNPNNDMPIHGIDGTSARWSSGTSQYTGMWYSVNFGKKITFDKITMDASNSGDYPRNFTVYVSNNGTDWTSVTSAQNGNDGITTTQFATQNAQYVKIQLNTTVSNWWSLFELNVYNDTPAAPPSFTTSVTTTGSDNTLTASVQNAFAGNTYQMWVYQKLPADVTGQATDQYIWVPMTAGANNSFSLTGATADVNGNYHVSMIETDASGNVVSRNFDTPASLPTNAVRIEKILVGGKVTNGRETVNLDDSAQATQNIQIVADNATGYTLIYGTADNQTSVQAGSSKDTFPVSFANLGIGTYTFTATATNDAGQKDVRTFTVTTYSTAGSGHATPVISGMTGGFTGNSLGLTLTGKDTANNTLQIGDGFLYRFRAGEPGRGISYSASSVSGPTGSVFVPVGKYGTYQVYATAAYGSSVAYDDAAMGYYDYTRPGGAVTVSSYTVKENGGADSSATDQTGTTGKNYTFNATANTTNLANGETARYSFWRCDASGWVLLKDWSPDATLSWTPAYAGKYIIQVRVQGSKAGSYESARNMTFDVTSATGLVTAKNVSLTLTVTGNKARQPVTLTTAATPSAGLLYRYEVQDPTLGLTLLNAYSPDNTFTWVPRKAGSYTVYVQVINQNSFGMYDAQTSQPATIN